MAKEASGMAKEASMPHSAAAATASSLGLGASGGDTATVVTPGIVLQRRSGGGVGCDGDSSEVDEDVEGAAVEAAVSDIMNALRGLFCGASWSTPNPHGPSDGLLPIGVGVPGNNIEGVGASILPIREGKVMLDSILDHLPTRCTAGHSASSDRSPPAGRFGRASSGSGAMLARETAAGAMALSVAYI